MLVRGARGEEQGAREMLVKGVTSCPSPLAPALFEDVEVLVVGRRLNGQQVEHGMENVMLLEHCR